MNREDKAFADGAVVISDEAIRRSLLASADSGVQAKFERLLMLDDRFEKRVHRLELELADDFSFEQLNAAERKLFTNRFLVTPGRLRELDVSQALRKALLNEPSKQFASQTNHFRATLFNLFGFDRSFAIPALTALTLLLLSAMFRLSIKGPIHPAQIAKRQPVTNTEREYSHAGVSQSPGDKSVVGSTSVQEHNVASVTLRPDNDTTNRQLIHISGSASGESSVHFELLVNSKDPGVYHASLMSETGQQITAFSDLKFEAGDHANVVLTVPAHLLNDSGYYIELKRISEDKADKPQRYSFQVTRD